VTIGLTLPTPPTRLVSRDTAAMGFDPTRPKKVRPGDYVAMAAAAVATVLVVVWAVFG